MHHIVKALLKKAVLATMLSFALIANGQDGKALFQSKCTACHTVGKGRLVGPDLKGVNDRRSFEWFEKFVNGSQAFVKEDADAKALFAEFGIVMPNQGLSDEEAKAIYKYLSSFSAPAAKGTKKADTKSTAAVKKRDPAFDPANASKEDIRTGMLLFEGRKRFKNRGPACISCHNVNSKQLIPGGRLAKDLSDVWGRSGEAGIKGVLTGLPFPAMKQSYAKHPLTEKEIFYLLSFFKRNSDGLITSNGASNGSLLLAGGIGAFLLFGGLITILWMDRKRRGVKDDIFARQNLN